MGDLYRLKDQLLSDGCVTDQEVSAINAYIHQNGKLDLDDVKFLVGLLSEAREVSAGFDAIFFPALKQVVLQDGRVGLDEQFYLLKMLYADGKIRDSERKFLREVRAELQETSPEFESLFETAMNVDNQGWCVGGAAR
jgi:uncharacterized tellurite resistance protein B-like protein